jgi:hypothetical protein
MNQPIEPPSVYQLRIVLREISPLIWRRLLVRSDPTLVHLHTMLQITFDWQVRQSAQPGSARSAQRLIRRRR